MSRFGVIIADPPWAYRVGGVSGDVAEQYETMNRAALEALPIADWAAPDCVLLLWATWPKLDEALPLIAAWGFDYVSGFPWIKTVASAGTIRRGIGFWTQGASEMVLIGRRGDVSRAGSPVLGLLTGEARQFWATARGHSRKPPGLHGWCEENFGGPYLELFARRERPGWTTWGADVGFRISPSGCEPVPNYRSAERQLCLQETLA